MPVAAPNGEIVRVDDAQFGYGGRVAVLADISVRAGEVVAIVGHNGSGKSTLLKGMLGLNDRISGSVSWFGRPLSTLKDRSRLGYVPQRQSVVGPNPVSVAELVLAGRLSGQWWRPRPGATTAVRNAVGVVGLTDRIADPVSHLSGGQQRRALIARALVGGADVLLLDEPFAGVDHDSQLEVAAALRRLAADGATILIVLHELESVRSFVTRVIHLVGGHVRYDGSPDGAPPELADHVLDHDPHGGESDLPDGRGERRFFP